MTRAGGGGHLFGNCDQIARWETIYYNIDMLLEIIMLLLEIIKADKQGGRGCVGNVTLFSTLTKMTYI